MKRRDFLKFMAVAPAAAIMPRPDPTVLAPEVEARNSITVSGEFLRQIGDDEIAMFVDPATDSCEVVFVRHNRIHRDNVMRNLWLDGTKDMDL